jgi:hypothetical protein
MHGETNIRFISAQQTRSIYNFRNIKEKLQKTIASILFNKIRKAEQLQPKYFHIKERILRISYSVFLNMF